MSRQPSIPYLSISLASDSVYTLGSDQVKAIHFLPDGTNETNLYSTDNIRAEVNSNSIAFSEIGTLNSTGQKKYPFTNGAHRLVYIGKTLFNGNEFSSIDVTEEIGWLVEDGKNYIEVYKYNKPQGLAWKTPKNYAEIDQTDWWDSFHSNAQLTYYYNENTNNPNFPSSTKSSTTLDQFFSLPEAQYFSRDWAIDPTSQNVLADLAISQSDSGSDSSSSNNLSLSKDYSVSNVISNLLGNSTTSSALSVDISDKTLTINASSWSGSIKINLAAKASDKGDTLTAKQIDFNSPDTFGSVIQGGSGNDVIMGKAGWDILDGGAGNDLIHGGNGRDIITGGLGSDELHGDFGWNTYKSEKDGSSDLIAIKSDQWLVNWMYGQAGNNPNGEKADIIEGLDSIDQIRIIGCDTKDLTFQANATAHGVSGIGIYAKGALEAVYTGGDLSLGQIQAMTSGDGSSMAMNNNINSYGWTQHPGIFTPS